MARTPRIVLPGVPHHIAQRGNRKQKTFFCEFDYRHYLSLLAEHAVSAGMSIWCYCLMPNHVHLIAVPTTVDGLSRGLGETHQRYTLTINRRKRWKGYLWQGRFSSYPMDEEHTLAAARYILLNPFSAKLEKLVGDWPYSSLRAHLTGKSDGIVDVAPLAERIDDWAGFLQSGVPGGLDETLAKHLRTGLPAGSRSFVRSIEKATGRSLVPKKRGRPVVDELLISKNRTK